MIYRLLLVTRYLSLVTRYLLLVTCHLLLVTPLINASTLLGRQAPVGDLTEGLSARQVGMGGARIAVTNDSTALFINPAQLSKIKKLDLVFSAPLYSTYEKVTHADNSKSFDENSQTYLNFPLFAAGYSFVRWTLAVGWSGFSDFHYFHNVETFSQGKLARQKRAEDFGGIRILAGAASYRFEKFSLGLSYLAYRGTPSFRFKDVAFNTQTGALASSTIYESEKVFGGRQMMGGISFYPNEKTEVGAALKGRFTMSETETKIEQGKEKQTAREWKMPWELGLGFTYKFSEKGTKPMIAFNAIKSWWGKSELSINNHPPQPAGLVDTLSYHLGMEHYLRPAVPLRYGLAFLPFYGREEADTFVLSLGSGYLCRWKTRSMSFDISGEYRIRSASKTTRLFPEPEDPSLPFINQDVADSYVKRFMATITYKF